MQIGFGRDKHRAVVLQKAQDAIQRREVVAQSVKALHHDGIDAALLHGGQHCKQSGPPKLGAVLLLHAGVDDDITAPVGFTHAGARAFAELHRL